MQASSNLVSFRSLQQRGVFFSQLLITHCSLLLFVLSACGSGAVMFAPTPLPPDLSPLRYQHPGGAFSLLVPRAWAIYEQNTTNLAAAAFAAPGDDEPLLSVAVVNLGDDRLANTQAFSALINDYQSEIRPDAAHYVEQDRQAMGDGSWRLTGLRTSAGGISQQVNTFIERTGPLLTVMDVTVPEDSAHFTELQMIINTFAINPDTPLEVSDPTTLAFAVRFSLDILHVAHWTTPAGVFFITGEVANTGTVPVSNVPVRAVLSTADDIGVAEAVDTVMGYTILPGGFAPFSLRFGQGQPALTSNYTLTLGNEEWQSGEVAAIYGANEMTWTDESSFTNLNQLLITGTVTNISGQPIRSPLAVATVFDAFGNVIAAGFTAITPELAAGAASPFQIVVPEVGSTPANYIVNIQGLE
jgi:hypothetical protein